MGNGETHRNTRSRSAAGTGGSRLLLSPLERALLSLSTHAAITLREPGPQPLQSTRTGTLAHVRVQRAEGFLAASVRFRPQTRQSSARPAPSSANSRGTNASRAPETFIGYPTGSHGNLTASLQSPEKGGGCTAS